MNCTNIKRDAGNAILNIQSKTVAANFSASNGPTGFTLLSYLPDCHSKLPQKYEPWFPLDAENLAEAVLLSVFDMALSASLLV